VLTIFFYHLLLPSPRPSCLYLASFLGERVFTAIAVFLVIVLTFDHRASVSSRSSPLRGRRHSAHRLHLHRATFNRRYRRRPADVTWTSTSGHYPRYGRGRRRQRPLTTALAGMLNRHRDVRWRRRYPSHRRWRRRETTGRGLGAALICLRNVREHGRRRCGGRRQGRRYGRIYESGDRERRAANCCSG
jgi:hypothetical protein